VTGPSEPPRVVTLAGVQPEQVHYLWPGRLPLGKIVVLDGDPSVGKSTLTTDLAARVSTGAVWPDRAAGCPASDVVLMSAEDGLADTIAPRLTAAGADLARVHALTEVVVYNEAGQPERVPPSLPRDIAVIEYIVTAKRAKLLVIDVLMAYLAGKVDSHRDQDVRSVLHQLAAMADRTGCTVLLIRHLNKSNAGPAIYRGGGSIGIIGAARAAYLVARDPEDEDRRVLATLKSNLFREPPSLAYRLVSDPTLDVARVEWEPNPVEFTAATLLRAPLDHEERTERDEASEWLLDYLASNNYEAPSMKIKKAARAEGFSDATLKRAKQRAGVGHYSTKAVPRQTYWTHPELQSAQSDQSVQDTKQVSQLGQAEPTVETRGVQSARESQSAQLAHRIVGDPTEPPTTECDVCGKHLETEVLRLARRCRDCLTVIRGNILPFTQKEDTA